MSLDYELGRRGNVVLMRLTGRIDREAGTTLDVAYAAAAASDPPVIEVDFAGVDYINSTGIALIVGVLSRARADRRKIRALGLTDHYRHIFEITRLSDFIEVVEPIPR
ncbi:STAS domain-containing protein [Microbacterium sp. NPDC056044]|uniref:STAS domain-containing protein n=1 Tax=Microbacterium sp. NPDC056044 TaxID=3345690 RepID=UPI0035DF8A38